MNKSKVLFQTLLLLGVVFVGFFIRTSAYDLPAVTADEKSCFQDDDGNPYLTEMDSYFYLRNAREMAENGTAVWYTDRFEDPLIGQKTSVSGKADVLPLGLSALAYLLWKYILSHFGISLTQTAVWLGPVLGSLAFLPAFCYVRKRTSLAGGIAAGLLAVCTIPFAAHTHAGFFDTDMVLAFLPLAAILSLLQCLRETRWFRQLIFASLSAASFALLSLFWEAYYAYFLFAIIGTILAFLLTFLLPRALLNAGGQSRRLIFLRGALFSLGLTACFLILLGGSRTWDLLSGVFRSYHTAMGVTDAMPFALRFISEMQPLQLLPKGSFLQLFKAEPTSLLGRLGGLIPCLAAFSWFPVCLLYDRGHRHSTEQPQDPKKSADVFFSEQAVTGRVCKKREERYSSLLEVSFLGLWTVIGILLAHRSVRLAELPVLPLTVLFGLLCGRLFSLAGQLKKLVPKAVMFCILCLFIAASVFPSFRSTLHYLRKSSPAVTDTKCEAMTAVRDTTSENTALASWWDDGYYMEYQSERRTLTDGGTDNGAASWLMARALTTDDPGLMAGILRMMNESGTDALEFLTDSGMDQAEAAELLLRILPLKKTGAAAILSESGISQDLLLLTHPADPDPLLLILNSDMLRIYRSLGYFGFWDPAAGAQAENVYMLPSSGSAVLQNGVAEFSMTDSSYSVILRQDSEEQGQFTAEYLDHGERCIPCRLVLWENGKKIQDTIFTDVPYAVVIVKEKNRYCAVLCSENMCDSMLIRLLVCEDKSIPCAAYVHTWYGQENDPCSVQRRINYTSLSSAAVQAWEIDESC